jgi:threonine/homoserine/homoserine lactone efflux protein
MLATLLPFVGVSLVVICTPGPDTALTVRNVLLGGRRAGLLTAAGVAMGQLVWTIGAGAGVSGLLAASGPAFRALQLAGAVYLVFLGAQSLRSAACGGARPPATSPRVAPGRALRQGLVSNLANPKMAVFFVSLFPQFAPPGPGGFSSWAALGALFCAMTFGWLAGYGLLLDRVRPFFDRSRVRRTVDAVAGTVLVGFGVRLAAQRV